MAGGGQIVVIKRDGSDGQTYKVAQGSITIGSDKACDIRIPVKGLSPLQCSITVGSSNATIKNLSSSGPTLVNSSSVSSKILVHGDILSFNVGQFRWDYIQKTPHKTLTMRKSKGSAAKPKFVAKRKSFTKRKSFPINKKTETQIKKLLGGRNSLDALIGKSRQVAVVKPQRREESVNSTPVVEAIVTPRAGLVSPKGIPRNRITTPNTGRKQQLKRISTNLVSADVDSSLITNKRRKINDIEKVDTPVVIDKNKRAALMLLTGKSPKGRGTPSKSNESIIVQSVQEAAILSTPIKESPPKTPKAILKTPASTQKGKTSRVSSASKVGTPGRSKAVVNDSLFNVKTPKATPASSRKVVKSTPAVEIKAKATPATESKIKGKTKTLSVPPKSASVSKLPVKNILSKVVTKTSTTKVSVTTRKSLSKQDAVKHKISLDAITKTPASLVSIVKSASKVKENKAVKETPNKNFTISNSSSVRSLRQTPSVLSALAAKNMAIAASASKKANVKLQSPKKAVAPKLIPRKLLVINPKTFYKNTSPKKSEKKNVSKESSIPLKAPVNKGTKSVIALKVQSPKKDATPKNASIVKTPVLDKVASPKLVVGRGGRSIAAKIATPKAQTPKAQPPKGQTPKVQTPKAQTLKAQTPKAQTPKVQTPKVQTPKAQTPKVQTPKAQTPKAQTPKVQTPKAQTPKTQTPKVQTPKTQTPKVQTPKAQTPKVQTPKAQTPKIQTSKAQTPKAQTPKAQTPKVQTPKSQSPKVQSPKALRLSKGPLVSPKAQIAKSPATPTHQTPVVKVAAKTPKSIKGQQKTPALSNVQVSKTPRKQSSKSPQKTQQTPKLADKISIDHSESSKVQTPKSPKAQAVESPKANTSVLKGTPKAVGQANSSLRKSVLRKSNVGSPFSKSSASEVRIEVEVLNTSIKGSPKKTPSKSPNKSLTVQKSASKKTPSPRKSVGKKSPRFSIGKKIATPKAIGKRNRASLAKSATKSVASRMSYRSVKFLDSSGDLSEYESFSSPSKIISSPISNTSKQNTRRASKSPNKSSTTTPKSKQLLVGSSPIVSPKQSSPRTPDSLIMTDDANINTTPNLSILFDLEASTPKETRKSLSQVKAKRMSSRKSAVAESSKSIRKSKSFIRKVKTEPRKILSGVEKAKLRQSSRGQGNKSVDQISNSSDATDVNAPKPDNEIVITPKSIVKLVPELLKEKHSTAKKSVSRKAMIDHLTASPEIAKELFKSPVKRKLSQSIRIYNTSVVLDDQDASIVSAARDLSFDSSFTNKKSSLPKSPNKAKTPKENKKTTPMVSSVKSQRGKSKSPIHSVAEKSKSITKSKPKIVAQKVKNLIKRTAKSPKNDLTDVKGVKHLLKTPRAPKSPKNDLTNVRGLKNLYGTPRPPKSPKNDLTNVHGVKKILATPKIRKSPKNDLTNVQGIKKILGTPRPRRSPKNDLTNVAGIKKLLNTPRPPKSPKNDLSNVRGLKKLMDTPRPRKSPKNDLTNVAGIRKILKTPRPPKSPKNDLTNVSGVDRIFKSPKTAKSPKNDLTNVRGVKKLMATPKQQKTPKNDLTNVAGVKKILKTPRVPKSPKNNLLDISGISSLMKSPKGVKSPKNDLSNVSGVKNLFESPKQKQKSPKSQKSNKSLKNSLEDISGIGNLFGNISTSENLFDSLTGRTPVKTYAKKPAIVITSPTPIKEKSTIVVASPMSSKRKSNVITSPASSKKKSNAVVSPVSSKKKPSSSKKNTSNLPIDKSDVNETSEIRSRRQTTIDRTNFSIDVSKAELGKKPTNVSILGQSTPAKPRKPTANTSEINIKLLSPILSAPKDASPKISPPKSKSKRNLDASSPSKSEKKEVSSKKLKQVKELPVVNRRAKRKLDVGEQDGATSSRVESKRGRKNVLRDSTIAIDDSKSEKSIDKKKKVTFASDVTKVADDRPTKARSTRSRGLAVSREEKQTSGGKGNVKVKKTLTKETTVEVTTTLTTVEVQTTVSRGRGRKRAAAEDISPAKGKKFKTEVLEKTSPAKGKKQSKGKDVKNVSDKGKKNVTKSPQASPVKKIKAEAVSPKPVVSPRKTRKGASKNIDAPAKKTPSKTTKKVSAKLSPKATIVKASPKKSPVVKIKKSTAKSVAAKKVAPKKVESKPASPKKAATKATSKKVAKVTTPKKTATKAASKKVAKSTTPKKAATKAATVKKMAVSKVSAPKSPKAVASKKKATTATKKAPVKKVATKKSPKPTRATSKKK